MEMWRWYWQVLFAGWHLSPADWCDWARQRDRGFLQTVLCKWSYPSLKNLFHICNRWLANPKTSFWKAKSPTGTGTWGKWVAEFFFLICKFFCFLSFKASTDESFCQEWRNGAFWWREGREGGVWIMGCSQCQVWQNFVLNMWHKFLHVLILNSIDWKCTGAGTVTTWKVELMATSKSAFKSKVVLKY